MKVTKILGRGINPETHNSFPEYKPNKLPSDTAATTRKNRDAPKLANSGKHGRQGSTYADVRGRELGGLYSNRQECKCQTHGK